MQRGTIVERLKEEVVRNCDHLHEILKICEGVNILSAPPKCQ
jgi:hypothetical protein